MQKMFVDYDLCLGCRTCELRCAVERSSVSKNLFTAFWEEIQPKPRNWVEWTGEKAVALQCRHCEDAPCIEVCPTGAAKRDELTGTTFIDDGRCIGCWMCVMSCPYGIIRIVSERKVSIKCDACYQMDEPYCVASCPTGAIMRMEEEDFNRYMSERRRKNAAY